MRNVLAVLAALISMTAVASAQEQSTTGIPRFENGKPLAAEQLNQAFGAVSVPVGAIIMWWGNRASPPPGWEICDGTEPWTPNATFRGKKPDLQDRFPKGAPAGRGALADDPSRYGGSNNLPAHWHDVLTLKASGGVHQHNIDRKKQNKDDGPDFAAGSDQGVSPGKTTEGGGEHGHTITGSVGPKTGLDGDGNDTKGGNQPAYCEVYFLIKVK